MQKNGIQKYVCKSCYRYQQATYLNKAWNGDTDNSIAKLLNEGVALRGIARILDISLTTIIKRIQIIASGIRKVIRLDKKHVYEMDELWTYTGNKKNEIWLMYVFDRQTKSVIDFKVGARTKENLKSLVDQILQLEPVKICTDGLNIYKSLIEERIHETKPMSTRHIERFNLNLRMHLKRLSRKTICFSKSKEMLEACLRIYFWKRAVA